MKEMRERAVLECDVGLKESYLILLSSFDSFHFQKYDYLFTIIFVFLASFLLEMMGGARTENT